MTPSSSRTCSRTGSRPAAASGADLGSGRRARHRGARDRRAGRAGAGRLEARPRHDHPARGAEEPARRGGGAHLQRALPVRGADPRRALRRAAGGRGAPAHPRRAARAPDQRRRRRARAAVRARGGARRRRPARARGRGARAAPRRGPVRGERGRLREPPAGRARALRGDARHLAARARGGADRGRRGDAAPRRGAAVHLRPAGAAGGALRRRRRAEAGPLALVVEDAPVARGAALRHPAVARAARRGGDRRAGGARAGAGGAARRGADRPGDALHERPGAGGGAQALARARPACRSSC